MLVIEEEGLYVELEQRRQVDVQSEMLETTRSVKAHLEILNGDNAKLLISKYE